MKQTLYSNECIPAENLSTKFNLKSDREEVFLIISLKTVFNNLNIVKSYDKTNQNLFVFSLRDKYGWGLTFFGQYIYMSLLHFCMSVLKDESSA